MNLDRKIIGTAYISFIINKKGIAENFKIEKDVCEGCSKNSLNILMESIEQWIPAQIDGEPYESKFIVSIIYENSSEHNSKEEIVELPTAKHFNQFFVKKYDKKNNNEDSIIKLSSDGLGLFEFSDLQNAIAANGMVKFLYLNSQKYDEFPVEILDMTALKLLDLTDNQISSINHDLNKLPQLKELYLRKNKINSISESIGNVGSIEVLDLSKNELEIFPKAICNLKKMRVLDLSDNKIQSIPNEIKAMRSLEVLALANNNIKEIPEELNKLKRLKKLYIEGNNLDENEIQKLKKNLKRTEIITEL
jgi:Leucine-rich repeat (LRR) protein